MKRKLFFIWLPLALVFGGGILYFSSQKFLADTSCGCGPPSAEATGDYEQDSQTAFFNGEPLNYRLAELAPSQEALSNVEGLVLGEAADERWIEIDLSDQKLYAHNGQNIDYEFLVSSGKWAPTPTGEFRIWTKMRYTKMEGGKKETHTYYYLPNVPYTQYFYKGYGLHGTYWHNNFGQPMSHGCVNLATPDAEKLFYWTSPPVGGGQTIVYPTKENPGTRVVIRE